MRKIAYKTTQLRVKNPVLKKKYRVKGVSTSKFSFHVCRRTRKITGNKKRKKKKNTPWKSVNQFKRRKSTKTVGHPVWVYKRRGRVYKYLTFTHKPVEGKEQDFEKLFYNIDPDDIEDCYVKKQFSITDRDAFEDPDKKYRIHEKDKDTVRKYQK